MPNNNSLHLINARIETRDTNSNVPLTGPTFHDVLNNHRLELKHAEPQELQINLGKLCNLACHHCHVDAGPKRTEIMDWATMEKILEWVKRSDIRRVDLTGGAPELNPHFKAFCAALIKMNVSITSRCNITVLFEPQQESLAQWYADNKIRLVCSLPCYTEDNVDAQRGKGTFDLSIKGLKLLNSLGYGLGKGTNKGRVKELMLDLVYNPNGAFLPPEQTSLEQDYRHFLLSNFEITFSSLLTITNIPINRFAHALHRDGQLEEYQDTLVDNFNTDTIPELMCRHIISVDWRGLIYDCDFNQMLELPFAGEQEQYLWELDVTEVASKKIITDRHCFGCTAGAGSSCGGALSQADD